MNIESLETKWRGIAWEGLNVVPYFLEESAQFDKKHPKIITGFRFIVHLSPHLRQKDLTIKEFPSNEDPYWTDFHILFPAYDAVLKCKKQESCCITYNKTQFDIQKTTISFKLTRAALVLDISMPARPEVIRAQKEHEASHKNEALPVTKDFHPK